jgi:hypothetical protein
MGKEKEPLDSLTGRPATGIHQVATATIIAKDATREELDLAALILRRDPARAAPRENESTVETFNRLLDVAIDSANDSAHCGTRAERRALLVPRSRPRRVVLIDCATLAELVEAKLELDGIKLGLSSSRPARSRCSRRSSRRPRARARGASSRSSPPCDRTPFAARATHLAISAPIAGRAIASATADPTPGSSSGRRSLGRAQPVGQ